MKNFAISTSVLFLLVSCSNPHIEKKSGLERALPTQGSDEGSATNGSTTGSSTTGGSTTGGSTTGGSTTGGSTTGGSTTGGSTTGGSTTGGSTTGGSTTGGVPQEVTMYIGNAADAHRGIDTTGFATAINLSSSNRVDFNQTPAGTAFSLSDANYKFTVKQEEIHPSCARHTLYDFFGKTIFRFRIENPVSQDQATGKDMGVDIESSSRDTERVATIWKFSKPIAHFAATLVDVESTKNIPAKFRLFDCKDALVKELPYVYPNSEDGNSQIHFVGFSTTLKNVCTVSLTVGDYPPRSHEEWPNNGSERAIALDDFLYGFVVE